MRSGDDSCGFDRDYSFAGVLAKPPDPDSKYKTEAMAAARLVIARRIARLCTSLSPAEFERLLDKMVGIHWKYDILPHLDPIVFEEDDVNLYLDT